MKTEPEIILPYEDLPNSGNELIKSLKILQDTVKYYGEVLLEIKISIDKIEKRLETQDNRFNGLVLSSGKEFTGEEIETIYKKRWNI